MTSLDKRYRDMLGKEPDTKLERLVTDLDVVAERTNKLQMPAEHHDRIKQALLTQANAQHQARQPQQRRQFQWHLPRYIHRYRWAYICIAVLCLFTLTGTVFALNFSLTDSTWQSYTKNFHTPSGQIVNMTKSSCGFTITLHRVYADANQGLLGIDVRGSSAIPNPNSASGSPTVYEVDAQVTDANGTHLRSGGSLGSTASRETDYIIPFDASSIVGSPRSVTLHVNIDDIYFSVPKADANPHVPPGCTVQAMPNPDGTVTLNYDPHVTFTVTTPFYAGRTLQLHQSALAGSARVTLEKVVFTPSLTRFYVSSTDQLGAGMQLLINGTAYTHGGSVSIDQNKGTYEYDGGLYNVHNVHAKFILDATRTLPNQPILQGGPVTFEFVIP